MSRTIRPIGPVTESLARLGFRQYAAIIEDGKQVRNVAILSKLFDSEVKYVGHFIDAAGESHTTTPMKDMKRAARRIMAIREQVMAEQPEPAPKPAAKKPAAPRTDAAAQRRARRAADRQPQSSRIAGTEALIDCKGCGTMHRDDTLCPW